MLTVECVRRDDSGQEVLHMTLDITEEADGKLSKKAVVFARGFGGAFFTLGNVSDAVEFVHLKSGELEEVGGSRVVEVHGEDSTIGPWLRFGTVLSIGARPRMTTKTGRLATLEPSAWSPLRMQKASCSVGCRRVQTDMQMNEARTCCRWSAGSCSGSGRLLRQLLLRRLLLLRRRRRLLIVPPWLLPWLWLLLLLRRLRSRTPWPTPRSPRRGRHRRSS